MQSTSTVQNISAQLEEEIVLGRLLPKERLIEDDLMDRFKVKRHIVREALSILQIAGLLVRERNKGAMVRSLTPREVEDLYVVRQLLEEGAVQIMPLPVRNELVQELVRIHEEHQASVQAGNLRKVFHLNVAFHRTIYSAADNSILAESIESYCQKTHVCRSYTIGDPDMLSRAVQEHEAMIEAIKNQDRDVLRKLVVEHMRPAKDAYLRRLGLGAADYTDDPASP